MNWTEGIKYIFQLTSSTSKYTVFFSVVSLFAFNHWNSSFFNFRLFESSAGIAQSIVFMIGLLAFINIFISLLNYIKKFFKEYCKKCQQAKEAKEYIGYIFYKKDYYNNEFEILTYLAKNNINRFTADIALNILYSDFEDSREYFESSEYVDSILKNLTSKYILNYNKYIHEFEFKKELWEELKKLYKQTQEMELKENN